jgi:tRNA pseudouridine32 synthase/23S rRNA pseudouridine746 synthase/23S rRNA pseudouridine1911/1915/1917 synthase
MGRSDNLSWLELKPQTGRTHQIRVHCAALGCPVLGDPIYGGEASQSDRYPLHLHARAVSLPLYPSRDPIAVTAPVPDHMRALLSACGFGEDTAAYISPESERQAESAQRSA